MIYAQLSEIMRTIALLIQNNVTNILYLALSVSNTLQGVGIWVYTQESKESYFKKK